MVLFVSVVLDGMVRFAVFKPADAGLKRTAIWQVPCPENGTTWLEHASEAIVKSVVSSRVTCPMSRSRLPSLVIVMVCVSYPVVRLMSLFWYVIVPEGVIVITAVAAEMLAAVRATVVVG